ncbi:MAG: hypothetical protein RLZ98_2612 [Pseudomonadota bacterium]|jgi:hypothetical protein
MPSLIKFLTVVSTVCAIGYAGLYVLATHFEPVPKEVHDPLPSVKIRRE